MRSICWSCNTKKLVRLALFLGVVAIVLIATIELTQYVSSNEAAQTIVNQFGYGGIVVIAAIAGLNVFLPVPAATFVPVFTAAGLMLPLIVVMLVIGTTVADTIGYLIGRWSKDVVEEEYPETYKRFMQIRSKNHRKLLPLIFLYSAFVPFPNEAFLIPVALMGVPLRTFFIPLVAGTLVNQAMLAYGAQEIFGALLGG